jgi:hypothetical protein
MMPAFRTPNQFYHTPTTRIYPAGPRPHLMKSYPPPPVWRPAGSQYQSPPVPKMQSVIHKVPPKPQSFTQARPSNPPAMPSQPPLHLRHNVERVVYKKPEQSLTQSKSSVDLTTPAPQSPTRSILGSERVVYNKTEKVVYDGGKEVARSVCGDVSSSDSSYTLASSGSIISISDSNTDHEDTKETVPILNAQRQASCSSVITVSDFDYKDTKENFPNAQRQVTYDQASESKITVTFNRSSPRKGAARNPQDIKNEVIELRKRLAQLSITKEIVNYGGLSCFITSADFKIPQPEFIDEPAWFNIKILAMDAPDNFTFQFNFPDVEDLQSKMKEFYDCVADTGTYLAKKLAKDMVVAVFHSNRWYRAQIQSFDDSTAEIIPIDCMTLKPKKLSRGDIHYLHKKFAEESQKSGRGRIYGILPKESDWSEEAKAEVAKLKLERRQATVKLLQNNIYHLSIIAVDSTRYRIMDILNEQNLVKFNAKCFIGPDRNFSKSLK